MAVYQSLSEGNTVYTPKCAPGALGIWSEVICRGGAGYRTDILEPALRPRSNIGLPDICSMTGAQRSSMEAPVGNYLAAPNSQISEPTQGSPERVSFYCYSTLYVQINTECSRCKINLPILRKMGCLSALVDALNHA